MQATLPNQSAMLPVGQESQPPIPSGVRNSSWEEQAAAAPLVRKMPGSLMRPPLIVEFVTLGVRSQGAPRNHSLRTPGIGI